MLSVNRVLKTYMLALELFAFLSERFSLETNLFILADLKLQTNSDIFLEVYLRSTFVLQMEAEFSQVEIVRHIIHHHSSGKAQIVDRVQTLRGVIEDKLRYGVDHACDSPQIVVLAT